MSFDQSFWEQRWADVQRDHAEMLAGKQPNPYLADRIEWVQADLGTWAPQPEQYDLVVSIYVHIAGDVDEAVHRLARGLEPDGHLLLVGHQGIEQTQVSSTRPATR